MVDPEDIDLEQLVSGGGEDVSSYSLEDVFNKVATEGVVYLDDKGKMLIKCPCTHISSSNIKMCAVYPMPDPDGDGSKMVCSGPLMRDGNRINKAPSNNCSYSPDRLENDGGWF